MEDRIRREVETMTQRIVANERDIGDLFDSLSEFVLYDTLVLV